MLLLQLPVDAGSVEQSLQILPEACRRIDFNRRRHLDRQAGVVHEMDVEGALQAVHPGFQSRILRLAPKRKRQQQQKEDKGAFHRSTVI